MGSSRLPEKVMKKLGNKTVIEVLVERLSHSKFIDKICVSTTKSKKDDKLLYLKLKKSNISEDQKIMLIKSFKYIKIFKSRYPCRFGDLPIDHKLLIKYQIFFSNYNVVTNTLKTTFPPGSEFLIYKSSDLIKLNQLVKQKDKYREHVGYNFTSLKT